MITITCKRVGYIIGILLMLIGLSVFIANFFSFKIAGLFGSLFIFLIGVIIFGFTWYRNGGRIENIKCCGRNNNPVNSSNSSTSPAVQVV
jgi:hypothetical protein